MTNEQINTLAAEARRAWKVAAEHPEEAAGLLDRVADCLEQIGCFSDPEWAIDYLRTRLDGLEIALGGGING